MSLPSLPPFPPQRPSSARRRRPARAFGSGAPRSRRRSRLRASKCSCSRRRAPPADRIPLDQLHRSLRGAVACCSMLFGLHRVEAAFSPLSSPCLLSLPPLNLPLPHPLAQKAVKPLFQVDLPFMERDETSLPRFQSEVELPELQSVVEAPSWQDALASLLMAPSMPEQAAEGTEVQSAATADISGCGLALFITAVSGFHAASAFGRRCHDPLFPSGSSTL